MWQQPAAQEVRWPCQAVELLAYVAVGVSAARQAVLEVTLLVEIGANDNDAVGSERDERRDWSIGTEESQTRKCSMPFDGKRKKGRQLRFWWSAFKL